MSLHQHSPGNYKGLPRAQGTGERTLLWPFLENAVHTEGLSGQEPFCWDPLAEKELVGAAQKGEDPRQPHGA